MDIGTSLLLGLIGSLHCAGMCGPLMLALPKVGVGSFGFACGRIGHNLGRLSAYALLGVVCGGLGQAAAMGGLQRWVSIGAGIVILTALLPLAKPGLNWPALKFVGFLKLGFSRFLDRRSFLGLWVLGFLNGFLPCGLVYVACAGALALGSAAAGLTHMLLFGVGTIPMMLGIGLLGRHLSFAARYRHRLVPICMALVGALLIVRGLALGIPYLSPGISASGAAPLCH